MINGHKLHFVGSVLKIFSVADSIVYIYDLVTFQFNRIIILLIRDHVSLFVWWAVCVPISTTDTYAHNA